MKNLKQYGSPNSVWLKIPEYIPETNVPVFIGFDNMDTTIGYHDGNNWFVYDSATGDIFRESSYEKYTLPDIKCWKYGVQRCIDE